MNSGRVCRTRSVNGEKLRSMLSCASPELANTRKCSLTYTRNCREFRDDASTRLNTRDFQGLYQRYDIALTEIDQHIASLRAAMDEFTRARTSLGKEYNRHLNIHALPLELLCTVFQEAMSGHDAKKEDADERKGKVVTALGISSVCSRWRSASIGHRALWSTIDFSKLSPNQVSIYRQRAGGYPLTLLSCDALDTEFARSFLFTNFHSSRTVHITASCPDIAAEGVITSVLTFLAAAPAAPSPLEELVCDLAGNEEFSIPLLDGPLFQGHTPFLRHLTFIGTRMKWCRDFYRNLSSLIIQDCAAPDFAADDDICHILRDCPRLYRLVLEFRREEDGAGADPGHIVDLHPRTTRGHVGLPPLRFLRLSARSYHLHRILSAISTLQSLQELIIDVHCANTAADVEAASLLPKLLPSSIFAAADILDVTWGGDRDTMVGLRHANTVRYGRIEGCMSRHERTITANPRAFLISWCTKSHEGIAYPFEDNTFAHLAETMRPHLKPTLSHRITLCWEKEIHPNDVALLLHLLSSESQGGAGQIIASGGIYNSVDHWECLWEEDDKDRFQWPTLEQLSFVHCDIAAASLQSIIKSCQLSKAIQKLHLEDVVLVKAMHTSFISAIDARKTRRRLLKLDCEVVTRGCVYYALEASECMSFTLSGSDSDRDSESDSE